MDLLEEGAGVDPASHWYYRSKARLMRSRIAGRVEPTGIAWDVGAGSGFFSSYLLANGLAGAATCIDPNYECERSALVKGHPLSFCRAPSGAAPDLVLLMDVLEHVEDPVGLLGEYVQAARPGATFFITVPAHQWLWSDHDVYLGHYRRYTRRLLEHTAATAGLTVDESGYYFLTIVPPVWAVRARRHSDPEAVTESDMKPASPLVNHILQAALAVERRLLGLNPWTGVSVVLVGHRPFAT